MKKIFIIDDDVVILKLCEHFLQRAGYEVRSFQSAELPLKIIKKEQPALLIIDYGLPGISGEEFIYELKKTDPSEIPHIFITGQTNQENLKKVKRTNPGAVFSKPFSPNRLVNAVKNLTLDNLIKR